MADGKMSVDEIVKVAAQQQSPDLPFDKVYNSIAAELQVPQTQFIRQGNTLFIIHPTDKKRTGFFRALNADSGENYLKNCEMFAKAAYAAGWDTLFTQFRDPSLINIFRYVGRSKPDNMGYTVEQGQDGTYQVTVKLGPDRDWR